MMSALQPETRAALLAWVKNSFDLDTNVRTLNDLGNGDVFGQMLHDLDPNYDSSELKKNASSWLDKKHNIQLILDRKSVV